MAVAQRHGVGGAPAGVARAGGAGGRWGIAHRPTGRWVAFGSEARCRRLAAQLAEVDALLTRPGPPPPAPAAAGRAGRGSFPGRA